MNKFKYILDNFFVPGFLDSLLTPGNLTKSMKHDGYIVEPIVKKEMFPEELICWDLISAPATPIHLIKS